MTTQLTALLATIAVAVCGLFYLIIGFAMRGSWRAFVRGIGVIVLDIGLYLSGLMEEFVLGAMALIAWAQDRTLDRPLGIALGVAGFGILLWIIGSFIPKPQKQAASPAPAPAPQAAPTPSTAKPNFNTGDDDELEITRILDARGI